MSLHSHSRSLPASRAAQQQAKIAAFKLECAQLENDLSGEDPELIVKRHIELLHTYNERKDATQIMIGKIAGLENCTVKEVQERLGIDLED